MANTARFHDPAWFHGLGAIKFTEFDLLLATDFHTTELSLQMKI